MIVCDVDEEQGTFELKKVEGVIGEGGCREDGGISHRLLTAPLPTHLLPRDSRERTAQLVPDTQGNMAERVILLLQPDANLVERAHRRVPERVLPAREYEPGISVRNKRGLSVRHNTPRAARAARPRRG